MCIPLVTTAIQDSTFPFWIECPWSMCLTHLCILHITYPSAQTIFLRWMNSDLISGLHPCFRRSQFCKTCFLFATSLCFCANSACEGNFLLSPGEDPVSLAWPPPSPPWSCLCPCVPVAPFFPVAGHIKLLWSFPNLLWLHTPLPPPPHPGLWSVLFSILGCPVDPAISVNKGCCGHQAVSHCSCPWLWTLRGFRVEKTGHWPQIVKVHMEGMISVSPDLHLPHTQKST